MIYIRQQHPLYRCKNPFACMAYVNQKGSRRKKIPFANISFSFGTAQPTKPVHHGQMIPSFSAVEFCSGKLAMSIFSLHPRLSNWAFSSPLSPFLIQCLPCPPTAFLVPYCSWRHFSLEKHSDILYMYLYLFHIHLSYSSAFWS